GPRRRSTPSPAPSPSKPACADPTTGAVQGCVTGRAHTRLPSPSSGPPRAAATSVVDVGPASVALLIGVAGVTVAGSGRLVACILQLIVSEASMDSATTRLLGDLLREHREQIV